MPDTITIIKTIHDTLKVSNSEALDILNKVDSYYNSAWTRLITVGSIIGIVIPLLYALYQRRLYNLNKKEMSDDIQKIIDERIEQKMQENIEKINKKIKQVDAGTFHVQGNNSFANKNYEGAYIDFVLAANLYLDGEDYVNLQIVLTNISDMCLPNLTYKRFDELRETKKADINFLLSKLEKSDDKGGLQRFKDKIQEAIIALKNKAQA